jgi:hypothetical protein
VTKLSCGPPCQRLSNVWIALADADAASGADFFRRLRDYMRLMDADGAPVSPSNGWMRRSRRQASVLRPRTGRWFAISFAHRQELAERVPALDDSGQPRPPGSLIDLEARRRLEEWTWTLSNFDALAADDG